MAVRGGWRPLSGLICEIVNSVGQGNFTFVREILHLSGKFYICQGNFTFVREILHLSGKSQGISNTYGCGNHVPLQRHAMCMFDHKHCIFANIELFTGYQNKASTQFNPIQICG